MSNDKAKRFQEITLPHLNAAYNLVRWLTRSNQETEDIVQEAYLRAYRFFDGFRDGNTARAWLLTIVRHTCYTWMQRNRDQLLSVEFDEDCHGIDEHSQASGNPETILVQLDDARRLNEALDALPLPFREILVMRELEELSYKEIATIADIPLGTVMSRLARGRKLLLERLRQSGD